jgi:RNA polymerase sigma factor for flagellar operon FliA
MGKRGRKSVAGTANAALWADQSAMASEQQSISNLIVALNTDLHSGPSVANGSALALPVVSTAGELTGEGNIARIGEPVVRIGSSGAAGRKTRMPSRATATAPARDTTPDPAATPSLKPVAVKESAIARRDRVVMENLPLVKAIALRVHDSLPVHVEVDDLVHAGILGLFDAATKYNPGKNVAFSSYAKHRIKGAILDSLRQLDWASRDMRRRHKQFEQITRELAASLQRNPTEEEIAAKMGVDVARWRQMAMDLRNLGLISASSRPVEQEDMPAPDFPCSADSLPDSVCAKRQLRSKLDTAMEVLPERYRKVVTLYYTNEMTMKEIGGLMGINESRVSQIHKLALEKMAHALHEAGITSSNLF